jgi:hypothetical protein
MPKTTIALFLLSLASCYSPDLTKVRYTCDPANPFCPDGLSCVERCCGGPPCQTAMSMLGFVAVPATQVGLGPDRLAAADVNNDAQIDVAVANSGSGTVSVLLGNGDGTFKAPAAQVIGIAGAKTLQVSFGDLNHDNKPDLVIANLMGDLLVATGNGDGTFASARSHSVGATPYWSAISDLDGDGNLDVAVANNVSNNVSVLLGDGRGAFRAAARNFPVGSGPTGLVIADSNRDGKPDVMTCNRDGMTVSALTNNGDGTFLMHQGFATNAQQNGITAADIDRDQKPDLITTNGKDGLLNLLFGNGDANGSFRATNDYVSVGKDAAPHGIASADFDLDGHADVVTANSASNGVTVLGGDGKGRFTMSHVLSVGRMPLFPVVADFNGDGRPDIAVANRMDNTVSVLLNAPR